MIVSWFDAGSSRVIFTSGVDPANREVRRRISDELAAILHEAETVRLPSLGDRRDDIPALVHEFIRQ